MPEPNRLAERRVQAALSAPVTTVAGAIQIITDGQAIAGTDLDLAARGTRHVLQFLRGIVTGDNIHHKFSRRGANLTVADAICHEALTQISMLEQRCRIGLAAREGAWDKPITTLDGAAEYLAILNGEKRADDSILVGEVHELSDLTFKCVAVGTVAVIAAPVVVTFLAEAGAVGLAAQVARTAATRVVMSRAATRVLTFVLTNPVAAVELTSFAVGTVVSIGMAGGPTNWLRGMTTVEGAVSTMTDVFVVYVAIRSGGAPAPRSGYRRVQVRVTARTPEGIQGRITQVHTVADLPPSAPSRARSASNHQLAAQLNRALAGKHAFPQGFSRDSARAAIQRARNRPSSRAYDGSVDDTFGGVCECFGVSQNLEQDFPGGRMMPSSASGDHMAYGWPYPPPPGGRQVILDASCAQFTEYVANTPAGRGKQLIPLARLRSENLLEAVQEGIFTVAEYERFVRLAQQYTMRPR